MLGCSSFTFAWVLNDKQFNLSSRPEENRIFKKNRTISRSRVGEDFMPSKNWELQFMNYLGSRASVVALDARSWPEHGSLGSVVKRVCQ